MMRTGKYWSANFQIWQGGHCWFWFVTDTSSAAIGAAPNEAEALGEACRLIEELAARRPGTEAPQESLPGYA